MFYWVSEILLTPVKPPYEISPVKVYLAYFFRLLTQGHACEAMYFATHCVGVQILMVILVFWNIMVDF